MTEGLLDKLDRLHGLVKVNPSLGNCGAFSVTIFDVLPMLVAELRAARAIYAGRFNPEILYDDEMLLWKAYDAARAATEGAS